MVLDPALPREKRGGKSHSQERNETAKSKSMNTRILYLYERNCTSVCGLKLRKVLKGNFLPKAAGAPPKGLGVHWQEAREQAEMSKQIKQRGALPTPCTLKFARLGKTSYFSWLVPDYALWHFLLYGCWRPQGEPVGSCSPQRCATALPIRFS